MAWQRTSRPASLRSATSTAGRARTSISWSPVDRPTPSGAAGRGPARTRPVARRCRWSPAAPVCASGSPTCPRARRPGTPRPSTPGSTSADFPGRPPVVPPDACADAATGWSWPPSPSGSRAPPVRSPTANWSALAPGATGSVAGCTTTSRPIDRPVPQDRSRQRPRRTGQNRAMDQSSPEPAFDGDGRLGFDPSVAARRLRKADPALGRVMDDIGPFGLEAELQRAPTLLHSLAEAITYQQLTAKAAETIFGRVQVYLPDAPETVAAERLLGTPDEDLRAAGQSRAKALAVRDLAQRVAEGKLPTLAELTSMSDDEVIERLTAVRGIGRWTAQMLLIFRLGRPDVLPTEDYGLRKGFRSAFGAGPDVPSPIQVAERGERWQPYRTIASWYLWRVAEST